MIDNIDPPYFAEFLEGDDLIRRADGLNLLAQIISNTEKTLCSARMQLSSAASALKAEYRRIERERVVTAGLAPKGRQPSERP